MDEEQRKRTLARLEAYRAANRERRRDTGRQLGHLLAYCGVLNLAAGVVYTITVLTGMFGSLRVWDVAPAFPTGVVLLAIGFAFLAGQSDSRATFRRSRRRLGYAVLATAALGLILGLWVTIRELAGDTATPLLFLPPAVLPLGVGALALAGAILILTARQGADEDSPRGTPEIGAGYTNASGMSSENRTPGA